MNVVGILCLVCLSLLAWVVFLKLELSVVEQQLGKALDPTPREDSPVQHVKKQKGLRSFALNET
ncbi:MAG: hypothetical protein ACI9OU_002386 [Candidatus Promineifilaceae bacterium]|jgi:hypothetical protein